MAPAGTDTGLVYDGFGRITVLPSADTGNAGGNATIGYYSNDLVRTQTQAGVTLTYTLDAAGRLAGHTSSAGGAWTNHYPSAGTDSPAWVAENATATTWTRNITGLDGQLVATIDQGGAVTWLVSNLHGDTTATATATDTEPSSYYLTDEYGKPVTGYTTPARYGWLGGKQRAHDDLAGLTLMGVRLYTPTLGIFLTVDPIPGGNPNPYTYPVDPINMFDLDGRFGWGDVAKIAAVVSFGVCVFASAGACLAVGLAAGVIAARASAGCFACKPFYRAAIVNMIWAGVGAGAGKIAGKFVGRAFQNLAKNGQASATTRLSVSHSRLLKTVKRRAVGDYRYHWSYYKMQTGIGLGMSGAQRSHDW